MHAGELGMALKGGWLHVKRYISTFINCIDRQQKPSVYRSVIEVLISTCTSLQKPRTFQVRPYDSESSNPRYPISGLIMFWGMYNRR